jgi:hypothetical protein
MNALDKVQRFENDQDLARQIEFEHCTAQACFEDQLRKLGIDPANPHMYWKVFSSTFTALELSLCTVQRK